MVPRLSERTYSIIIENFTLFFHSSNGRIQLSEIRSHLTSKCKQHWNHISAYSFRCNPWNKYSGPAASTRAVICPSYSDWRRRIQTGSKMAELEQFCILAKTQKGRACAALIEQVMILRYHWLVDTTKSNPWPWSYQLLLRYRSLAIARYSFLENYSHCNQLQRYEVMYSTNFHLSCTQLVGHFANCHKLNSTAWWNRACKVAEDTWAFRLWQMEWLSWYSWSKGANLYYIEWNADYQIKATHNCGPRWAG